MPHTPDTQLFRIPVTFQAYGIVNVEADSLEDAMLRATDETLLPDSIDLDGGYVIDDVALTANPPIIEPMFGADKMTHDLIELPRKPVGERLFDHYGVAVSFTLAGVVDIEALTLADAIAIAEGDNPLPTRVRHVYDYAITPDTVDHGKQHIPFFDNLLLASN